MTTPSAATSAASAISTSSAVPLLEVRGLKAGYGRAEVLHGLDLKAAPGSVITVIGPNGAGKSTLLNALMGVLPAKGQVFYKGEDISRLSLEDRVMLGLALVPEKRELFGSMPVEDNLILGGYRQMRLRNPKWKDQLEAVYQRFPRLKERRTQAAGTLSGGERQMLAVGRALMSGPELLMLDEPSLGLAPLIVKEILNAVDQLRATGVTILLVEQNARAALGVADHGYVLEMGAIALDGPAQALADDPRVIDTYLGAAKKK
jgi:branched-chain amino acid transport system ATP-binding protein